ncbi:MAG: sulfatase-like hydrolase/transferase [Parachlamydiaceae bacterium]
MQGTVETLLLIYATHLLKTFLGKKSLYTFISLASFLLIAHIVDFPLIRFMDMTVWDGLRFLTQENPHNIVELLYATNISMQIWFFFCLIVVGTLVAIILFYKLSERWTCRHPLKLSPIMMLITIALMSFSTLSLGYVTQQHMAQSQFVLYQKTLPWKDTFLPIEQNYIALTHHSKQPKLSETPISQDVLPLQSPPDIFLFVVESLREDYIKAKNAPHLHHFKKNSVSFDLALSNANATHISWFSLFHSQFPLYWGRSDKISAKKGSLPLQLLKQMGYKTHVYSSARLNYYQIGEFVFGENYHLIDELITYEDKIVCERDRKGMDKLIEKMNESPITGGRLFIVFLDSTHFDYSWPNDAMAPFKPYEEELNYFKAAITNLGIKKIKNRYRNSIHYVDSLFGEFFKALDSYSGKNDAVVVITGDHGEEFYEQGRLFHASCLSHPQIHVPLYYRFGSLNAQQLERERSMSCHMDIFPTLFHYLLGQDSLAEHFQGQSIFKKDRWPYTVVARFNAGRPPYEFCIHKGNEKLIASFSDSNNTFQSKGLHVISTKNRNDQPVPYDIDTIHEHFGLAFEHIFPL